MTSDSLPTIAVIRTRIVVTAVAVSTPAMVAWAYFLTQLLGISGAEWRGMALAAAVSTSVMGAFAAVLVKRLDEPIARYLQPRSEEAAERGVIEAAFQTTILYPRRIQQLLLAAWVGGAAIIGSVMTLMGYEGWGVGLRFGVLLLVAISCGVLSSTAFLFLAKSRLDGLRRALAGAIPDPERRRSLVTRMPLAQKMQAVVVGSSLASLMLVVAVVYTGSRDVVDARAAAWQTQVLEALAPLVERGGLAAARAAVLPQPELAAYSVDFVELDPGKPASFQFVLDAVARGSEAGTRSVPGETRIASWLTLPDGRVLVASTPRSSLPYLVKDLRVEIVVVLSLCTGLCCGLALLLSRDVTRVTEALGRKAERMAQGDLRRGEILESEDELGDLARGFERMGAALRETVERVAEAADRVDGAAVQISGVANGVSAASADQVRRIQQASELMLQINSQVNAVAGSAQALNESVEESSSSILELGAAGDELNDTASALSARVEDVSSSIEQMVLSVKQVRASSELLTDAATETSSSMEEMASAMRGVDTTAELTAELSRDVVTSAEKGQLKVSQTIDGIGAIRDSTDFVEQVVAGLATRAEEVGAILDVIDDVADETNLLALNAAIIAAQAGEHGRAFSVVADEIKELADRVLASTKEIGGLIRSVQDESGNAARAIESSSRSVATGVERSAEAGSSLEEITRASRESGTRIGEILSAVREQTKAASHVVELMERVRGGVEEITAAGGEQDRGNEVVFRSSVAMREVAQQVRRTTDEQARGFGRIRESIEGVREAVEQINGSLQEQSTACGQVAKFLEQVYERTRSNEEAAQQMGESTTDLVQYAEALRQDVAKFRT